MRNLGAVVSSPPKGSQPGAVGRVDRWFETVIAFARLYPCGIETAIAFAGAKWVFLARFSSALVLSVSMVAVQGRALVMVVSRWSASVVAEVSDVSRVLWRVS